MAYDLHIIRSKDWTDREGPTINEKDWTALIAGDPQLKPVDFIEGKTKQDDKVVMDMRGKFCAEWKAPSGQLYWIEYSSGTLVSSHASDELLEKMKEIAKKLGAKVQGDDGEFYE